MSDQNQSRPVGRALLNGFNRRCPSCEQGAIFDGYLKVHPKCQVCGLDLSHQRADDGPAWATMLIVLHMLPPIVLFAYDYFPDTSPWILASIASVFFLVMTLLLLPRTKGMFIAIQWANRMYGFGDPKNEAPSRPVTEAE